MLLSISLIGFHIVAMATATVHHRTQPTFKLSGPTAPGTIPTFEAAASLRALLLLKDRLGPTAIYYLLAPDIRASNAFWHAVAANSTPDVWVPATAHLVADVNLTTADFLAWFAADTGDPDKLLRGHPEHFAEVVTPHPTVPGAQQADILEAWAERVTAYRIPLYAAPDRVAHPFLDELPGYAVQVSGDAELEDGMVFAVVHNSFRDREAGRGVEGVFTVWVRDGTPEPVKEGLREHQGVEWANWLANADEDVRLGRFVPPA